MPRTPGILSLLGLTKYSWRNHRFPKIEEFKIPKYEAKQLKYDLKEFESNGSCLGLNDPTKDTGAPNSS